MKIRHILAICAFFCISLSASAQWYIGAKGGLSVSWIPGTSIYGYEKILPHNSFFAGAYGGVGIGDVAVLQVEALYAGKGHSDRSIAELGGRYNRELAYLQIPVFAGARIVDDRLTIMAGPEFGYLLFSKVKESDKAPVKNVNDCNRFNIALGLQFNYMITDWLGIDLKFDAGLNRTFSGDTIYKDMVDRGHNLSAQFGLCFRLDV